eukprot:gnl/Spiro4/24706_TR12268_c0_g1_i1.p1 gnl/Spiro4/24706_TR12268_c0_g1~~gnl/Spiro4/24706_TR12268_c0_g1_i1.p1  ORF type:complete len:175 (-),score=5.28 gnl/Spiro4/24706_TR12268_c0_g1_i1:27-524(-)
MSEELVAEILTKYNLQPHPEGGFFVETFRSPLTVHVPNYGSRSASTAILFCMTQGSISRLHKLAFADEAWHFYSGGSMSVVELDESCAGHVRTTVLGPEGVLQHVVRGGRWFGAFPNDGSQYSLVGCSVSPGFEYCDFELGSRSRLSHEFPQAQDLIARLTVGLP